MTDPADLAKARALLRRWVDTADMAKDLTFVPVAYATLAYLDGSKINGWCDCHSRPLSECPGVVLRDAPSDDRALTAEEKAALNEALNDLAASGLIGRQP